MGQIKAPSYLVLRGNTYHFRLALSKRERDLIGLSFLGKSLKTGYVRKAAQLARGLAVLAKSILKEHSHLDRGSIRRLILENFNDHLDKHERAMIMTDGEHTEMFPGPNGQLMTIHDAKKAYYDGPLSGPFQSVIKDTKQISKQVEDIFSKHKVEHDAGSFAFKQAIVEYQKLLYPFLLSLEARSNPLNYDFKHYIITDEFDPHNTGASEEHAQPKESVHILARDIVDKYVYDNVRSKHWKPRTKTQNIDKLKRFVEKFGDMPISAITGPMIREFKEMLMNDTARNSKGTSKTLSPERINDILTSVNAVFSFAVNNKYIEKNPATGLKLKIKKNGKSNYDKFTSDDLKHIFNFNSLDGRKNTKPWAFYVPVIALFSMARLEEVCQLKCDDIKCEDGIWFMDINDEDEKSVKNSSSIRRVPLHPFIISELRLIEFVKRVKNAGHDRLFPDLKRNDGVYNYGHAVSKWFNERYLKTIGVKHKDNKKVFHSLRHTGITNLQHEGVDPHLLASIAGHEPGLMTIGVYGEEYKLEKKLEAINKLDFGFDLLQLTQSKFVPR